MLKLLISLLVCVLVVKRAYGASLYDEQKDHVELLNKNNFDTVIYESDKASFVEFYAHWCG